MAKKIRKEISLYLSAEAKQLKAKLGEARKSLSTFKKKGSGAFGAVSQGMKAMGGVAGGMMGPLRGLTGAFGMLNVALGPIGIILGVIALAFKAVMSYLHGTTKGAKVLNKITSTLSAVMGVLTDALQAVGEKIIWAFTHPKDAIKELWKIIKQSFINRIQAVKEYMTNYFHFMVNGMKAIGYAIKGIFSPEARKKSKQYFAEMKQNAIEMAKASLKFATGIDPVKAYNKLKGVTKKVNENLERANRLAALKNERDQMSITLEEKREKLNYEYNKYYRMASDTSLTLVERKQAALKAQEKMNELTKLNVRWAEVNYEIQKEINGMGNSGTEALKKEHDLHAQVNKALADRETKLKRVDATYNSITKSLEKERDLLNEINKGLQKQTDNTEEVSTELADVGDVLQRDKDLTEEFGGISMVPYDIGDFGEELKKIGTYMASNVLIDFVKGLSDAFGDLVNNKASLKDFFVSFMKYLESLIIKLAITFALAVALTALLGGSKFGGLLGMAGSSFQSGVGWFKSLIGVKTPALASGGIVTKPTLAMIGEAGEPEAVIPLSRLNSTTDSGTVVFRIAGDELVGVLDTHNIQTNNF